MSDSPLRNSFQFRNILFLVSAGIFVLVSASIFVLNDNFSQSIETQYGVIDTQKTTILKSSIDNVNSLNIQIEDRVGAGEIYDSERIFSALESELLNQKHINSQALFSVIQKIDFNDQIDQEKIQLKLQLLNSEQSIKTEILVKKLNQLIYNDEIFYGSDLNLNAIATELLDEYDSANLIIDLENLLSF